MFVIIIYDAAPRRGSKLLKYLRQHLIWVQNSVFEGDVTESQFATIVSSVKSIINPEKDNVIFYKFESLKYSEREVLGNEKNSIDSFI